MRISIIIPAYNEEKRIGQTLARYLDFFQKDKIEIITVLDGCQDNTIRVVQEYQAKSPEIIKYINIKKRGGKGAATRTGFQNAKGDLIGFVDADGATSPAEFKRLISEIDGADAVIASRWQKGARVENRTTLRKIVSLSFILIVKLLFWLPFADTQCGAKIFKKSVINKILSHLTVNNMVFDVEILYLAKHYGFRIKEIPTVWIDQSSSAFLGSPLSLLWKSLNMFFTLINLRFKFLFKQ